MSDRALLFIYAETPIHAGGSESIGAIDLPIQRSVTTRLPVIWGHSLKGAIKDHVVSGALGDSSQIRSWFGSDPGVDPTVPGEVAFTEARVAAFPVPTLDHCFAWVTCPTALTGVARLARLAGISTPAMVKVASGQVVTADSKRWAGDAVVVGAWECAVANAGGGALWAQWLASNALHGDEPSFEHFSSKLLTDLLIIDDETFADLTVEFAEVSARIRLDEATKTVASGGLFYEECLPHETILVGLLDASSGTHATALAKVLTSEAGRVAQIGGAESVGRGIVWLKASAS